MMTSQTASTESQQGREEKRVRNHGITKWSDETPTDSCSEVVGKAGRGALASQPTCWNLHLCQLLLTHETHWEFIIQILIRYQIQTLVINSTE